MADFSRLTIQSQNLSNIDTVGYKRQVALTSGFDARLGELSSVDGRDYQTTTVSDVRPGVLKQTGRALDLALDGDGFFSVRTASGVRYTRRGDFTVAAGGRLVTAQGDVVLAGGGDLVLPNSDVRVDSEGKVYDGDRQLGQIDVVQFDDPRKLQYVGDAQFEAAAASPTTDRTVTQVRSGYLEASNVQPAHEMTALMGISRQVELTRGVLTSRDEMLDSAINTLAQF